LGSEEQIGIRLTQGHAAVDAELSFEEPNVRRSQRLNGIASGHFRHLSIHPHNIPRIKKKITSIKSGRLVDSGFLDNAPTAASKTKLSSFEHPFSSFNNSSTI